MSLSSILNIITCISFFQLALISFFNPAKFNYAANKWFALCFFAAGGMVLNLVLYQQNAAVNYSRLIAFNELSRFTIGPALYLAVVQFTLPDKSLKLQGYLHFIPFALFFVYMFPFLFANGNIFWNVSALPLALRQWLPVLTSLLLKIQILVYLLLSINRLRRHQINIELINANVDGINLKWLQYIIFSVALMLSVWYANMIFKANWIEMGEPVIFMAGVLLIGYFLLAQKEIYPFDKLELDEIAEVINPETPVVSTERFTAEQLEKHTENLTLLMETERVYLNNELSLPELAGAMHLSTHDLSYVLNKGINTSFFQFVNSYRVEEAKKLMLSKESKHLNMLGIAYSAGFNSKTTFNTVFKKQTGLSPSQFIRQAENGLSPGLSLQKLS